VEEYGQKQRGENVEVGSLYVKLIFYPFGGATLCFSIVRSEEWVVETEAGGLRDGKVQVAELAQVLGWKWYIRVEIEFQ
jgi:hypothetical protein